MKEETDAVKGSIKVSELSKKVNQQDYQGTLIMSYESIILQEIICLEEKVKLSST